MMVITVVMVVRIVITVIMVMTVIIMVIVMMVMMVVIVMIVMMMVMIMTVMVMMMVMTVIMMTVQRILLCMYFIQTTSFIFIHSYGLDNYYYTSEETETMRECLAQVHTLKYGFSFFI